MKSSDLREELKKEGIEFEEVFHKAIYTSMEGHMLSLPHGEAEAKNLFLKSKKSFVLMTVKGDKRVDLKAMAKAMGFSSFSFGKEDELPQTGSYACYPGRKGACRRLRLRYRGKMRRRARRYGDKSNN